jgi:hypothetical protein
MLIEILATSQRPTRCRRCGALITRADTIASGRSVAFGGRLVVVPAPSLFAGRDVVAVDTNRNPVHQCPGRNL